jgi:DNA polymerase
MSELPAAHIDFETASRTDLIKAGVYRYAEDPTTKVWGFSYRFGNVGLVKRWRPGDPDPVDLLTHIANGGMVVCHNAAFERRVWNFVLRGTYKLSHWPAIKIIQQDCTMSRAAAIAHPQSLDKLGIALGLNQTKDSEGHTLMMKMSRPRPRRFNPDGTIEWWDQPENVERLMTYCDQDIRTESEADERLPPLTDGERRVWMFDQVINDRGVYIDQLAVLRAAELVEFSKKKADSEMRTLTDRTVPKCSNDGKLIEWVRSRGIECDTVKKSVQDDLIFMGDLKGDTLVKEVIELRRAAKKTSTTKYKSMLNCVSNDSRIRGLLNYHGASTGRWAGRLVQPQNFPRVDYEEEGHVIGWLHELLHDQSLSIKDVYDLISAVHGPSAPLVILSRALRSVITAAPGKKLVGGDFSNIEGRVNAWIAGEEWKLQAFRDYDAGTGPDLYKLAYAKSFGITVEAVTKPNRQIGKVEELALGYQGSIGAFIDMGDTYGLNPYEVSGPIMQATSSFQWDDTAAIYHRSGTVKHGLQEKEWTAIKIIVDNWRKANPKIVQSWWDLQDAAIAAVSAPGQIIHVCNGKIQYYCDGRCLWCILPGGRMLCYSSPRVETEKVKRTRDDGTTYEVYKKKVVYWGVDSQTKQWREKTLYGGLQCENIVQAASRDVMTDRMFAAEGAGFPIILTVHDELLSEPDELRHDLDDKALEQIMSIVPPAFTGLPLAAAAWQDTRYVK